MKRIVVYIFLGLMALPTILPAEELSADQLMNASHYA